LISDYEFRIGHPIIDGITTFLEFETALLAIANKFDK